jgi:hypothetical protein
MRATSSLIALALLMLAQLGLLHDIHAQALPVEQARRVQSDIQALDLQYKKNLNACIQRFAQNACQAQVKEQYLAKRTELVDARQQWMSAHRNLEAEKALSRTANRKEAKPERQLQAEDRRAQMENRIKQRQAKREEKLRRLPKSKLEP